MRIVQDEQHRFELKSSNPKENRIYVTKIAQKVMQLLTKYRRFFTDQTICSSHCLNCEHYFQKNLETLIAEGKKLQFILPAFPAKSPNPNKTAGFLPDLGEKLSLSFLNSICTKINSFYESGTEIVICSDGRVFNDLLSINDELVSAYSKSIKEIIFSLGLTSLNTYDLESIYTGINFDEMRNKLLKDYGNSLERIKNSVKNKNEDLRLFNGIHRFVYEDYIAINHNYTKNKLRTITKELAYLVIQRSNAWSCLLEDIFPQAIRLSIHPQLCGSKKWGINLLKSQNEWLTPWHSVPLKINNDYVLVKKNYATSLNAKAIYTNDQFSHYIL